MVEKNFNVCALSGQSVTDEEVAEELNLPYEVCGTKDINRYAIEAVYLSNIKDGVSAGLSPEEATEDANQRRKTARKLSDTLEKNNPKGVVIV